MPRSEIAEKYARQVAICLFRGNYDAARSVVDEAEQHAMRCGGWDTPFYDLGIDQMTVQVLGRAGLFTPRDIRNETLESLQEIDQISSHRAGEIMKVMNRFVTRCH